MAINSHKLLTLSVSMQMQQAAASRLLATPNPFATGSLYLFFDMLGLIGASLIAHVFWSFLTPGVQRLDHLWPALILFGAVFWLQDLYPGVGITPVEELRRLVMGTSSVYLVLIAGIFLTKEAVNYSRGVVVLAGLLSVVLLPFARAQTCRTFSSRSWWGAPVIVLGAAKTARLVIQQLKGRKAIGFKPIACFDDDPSKLGECEGIPVLGPISNALELGRSLHIRYAILATPGISRQKNLLLLEQLSAVFPHVVLIPDLFGVSTLFVSARDLGGVLGLELHYNLLIPFNRWIKRAMDLIIAGCALILSAPVVFLSALILKILSPGRAFYYQEREGFGNLTIKIPKLRTMYPNADQILADYLRHNAAAQEEWDRHCKLKNDPRIIPGIGTFLRRASLDELPQLWSVLKGEMSLVGPRPFPSYHTNKFTPEFRAIRRKVIPGLTGLWQTIARSQADLNLQRQLDTYYIQNWSIWMDLYILSRTLRAVLSRNGAY